MPRMFSFLSLEHFSSSFLIYFLTSRVCSCIASTLHSFSTRKTKARNGKSQKVRLKTRLARSVYTIAWNSSSFPSASAERVLHQSIFGSKFHLSIDCLKTRELKKKKRQRKQASKLQLPDFNFDSSNLLLIEPTKRRLRSKSKRKNTRERCFFFCLQLFFSRLPPLNSKHTKHMQT